MNRERRDRELRQLADEYKQQGYRKSKIIERLQEDFDYLSSSYIEKILYAKNLKSFYQKNISEKVGH